jgi:hypothetical protein
MAHFALCARETMYKPSLTSEKLNLITAAPVVHASHRMAVQRLGKSEKDPVSERPFVCFELLVHCHPTFPHLHASSNPFFYLSRSYIHLSPIRRLIDGRSHVDAGTESHSTSLSTSRLLIHLQQHLPANIKAGRRA